MAYPQGEGAHPSPTPKEPHPLHPDPDGNQLMPEITEPPTIESAVLQLMDIISELITRVEALEAK